MNNKDKKLENNLKKVLKQLNQNLTKHRIYHIGTYTVSLTLENFQYTKIFLLVYYKIFYNNDYDQLDLKIKEIELYSNTSINVQFKTKNTIDAGNFNGHIRKILANNGEPDFEFDINDVIEAKLLVGS